MPARKPRRTTTTRRGMGTKGKAQVRSTFKRAAASAKKGRRRY